MVPISVASPVRITTAKQPPSTTVWKRKRDIHIERESDSVRASKREQEINMDRERGREESWERGGKKVRDTDIYAQRIRISEGEKKEERKERDGEKVRERERRRERKGERKKERKKERVRERDRKGKRKRHKVEEVNE